MGKTDLLNIKNFKKWILPILILISYKFIFDKMISYIVINRAGNFSKSILIGNFIVAIILFLLIKFIFKGKLKPAIFIARAARFGPCCPYHLPADTTH